MKIQYQILRENAKVPTRGSNSAAGYDLYAAPFTFTEASTIVIGPHETKKIGTALSVAIPEGYFGGIYARSGLATKQGLRPANCVGVVDSDYRGEIIVAVHNDSDEPKEIAVGDKIAQLVVQPYLSLEFEEVDELDETERGENGFGSTGR